MIQTVYIAADSNRTRSMYPYRPEPIGLGAEVSAVEVVTWNRQPMSSVDMVVLPAEMK